VPLLLVNLWSLLTHHLDIHAFLGWFDINFDCTHTKVKFSTGPHAPYTHWKCVQCLITFYCPDLLCRQTVFYTPGTPLRVVQGEEIRGSLTCAPNARNNRDLDISVTYATESSGDIKFDYKMCVSSLLRAHGQLNGRIGHNLILCYVGSQVLIDAKMYETLLLCTLYTIDAIHV
jgi:hypothetical protein